MDRSSLERFLRERVVKEGISAGLSADEAEGFFERWQWVRLWMQTLEEQRAPSGLLLYQLHEDRMDEAVSMTIDAGGESVETSRVIWMDVRDVPFVDDVVVSETADVPDPEPVPAVDSVVSVHEYGVIDTAYGLAEDKEVMRQSSAVIPQSMGDGSAFGISFYYEEVTDATNYHLYRENPIISDFIDGMVIIRGVSSFVLSTASPVAGYEDPASSIAWGSADSSSPSFDFGAPPPVMAASQVGEGRVVAVGDSHFVANYYLGLAEHDNEELILDIMDWLGGQAAEETRFRGTVTNYLGYDPCSVWIMEAVVEVEEVMSRPTTVGEEIHVTGWNACMEDPCLGSYGSWSLGDQVEVYGEYEPYRTDICGSEDHYLRRVVSAWGDVSPGGSAGSTDFLAGLRSPGDGATNQELQASRVSTSSRGHAALVEAPRQGSSGRDDTTVDVAVGTTFAQVYTDNESGDGTEDPENYFDPVQEGKRTPRRVTTDEDESSYAAVATMPDGNAVNVWNTSYYNGTTWVEEINYAILDPSGSFVLPVTRLTDNSGADEAIYDFSASADVAPNGNVAIGWAQQQDTDGDLAFNRSNARYVVVSRRGGVLRPPTFLTNNTGNYPRDYPPAVAALTSGRFLLAWEHAASHSGPVDIYYALLNNDGSIASPKTRLTDGTGFSVTPRVAPMPDGRAAIVWTTYNALGYREIAYATVDGSGSVMSGPIQITDNGSSGFESRRADVVALSDGRLAVAWTRETYGDQQIQYTIISGSEPPTPETATPSPTPETPTATPQTPTATPTETPTPTPSLTPTPQPPQWVTIASQDFEGAFPGDWHLHDNNGADYGDYVWGKRHCRRYAGGYSGWAVGGGAHGSALDCGDNYPNHAWSWLIYGPFSLTDATAAELRFKMWLNTEEGYDRLYWCGSTNGTKFYCDRRSGSTSGQWDDIVADLSNLDGVNYLGRPNVWVALIFYSDTYVNEPEGAYVDNILLRKFASPGHVQIESGSSLEGLTPLEVPEQVRLPDEANDAIRGPGHDRPQPGSVGSPGHANWVIRTVPNDLSRANLYVSLTTDEDDNLIMTWLDSLGKQYVFYALAGSNGNIRTPATILQRTRHSSIWSSKNGQGNDVLIPGVIPQKPVTVYLPAVLRDYRSGPPPPPVVNGGFESGEHGWTFGKDTSNGIRPAPRPEVVTSEVHGGSRAAVLGDENAPCEAETGVDGYRLSSWIYQDVSVPNTETAQLSFYYRMLTYDKWSAFKFDRLEVYLDGTLIGNLGNTASNYGCGSLINDLGWRQFAYDLSAYRGRTVRLKIVNVTDPDKTYSTWTYVDDVEVRP
jgi:hypothetical protein